MHFPCEVQRIARELDKGYQRSDFTFASLNPRARKPTNGYLVKGVVPSVLQGMKRIEDIAMPFIMENWLRVSARTGYRVFGVADIPDDLDSEIFAADWHRSLDDAIHAAKQRGIGVVWSIQGAYEVIVKPHMPEFQF